MAERGTDSGMRPSKTQSDKSDSYRMAIRRLMRGG